MSVIRRFDRSALCDLICLPGQERLIDLYLACAYFRVRAHLIARRKYNNIVQHEFLRIDDRFFPVPDHSGMRRVQHGQFVQHLFCPDFLHNTDQGICDDHGKKRKITERAHQTQHDCKHCKNQVEIRKYIFMYDLSCCFRRRFHRTVCPPVKPVFLNLLAGKPCSVIWIISGRLNPPGPLRPRSLLFFS